MVLVWNDAKSFKQHLEHMRTFRQSHHSFLESEFALLKDMPTSDDIHPPSEAGGARDSISLNGEPSLVPIYEVGLPGNSQN